MINNYSHSSLPQKIEEGDEWLILIIKEKTLIKAFFNQFRT